MRHTVAYMAALIVLAPLVAYAQEGMIELDSGHVISYDTSGVDVTEAYFDADFESLIFEMRPGSEPGELTLDIDTNAFGYPADLDEYYVQADAEAIDAREERTGGDVLLVINVEPGVTDVEVFGKIIKGQIQEPEIKEAEPEIVEEEPIAEPVPEPVSEPVSDDPMMDVPSSEPAYESQEITCGPGTVMVDDICMPESPAAENICGPGTVLDGGECVPKPAGSAYKMQECTGDYPIVSCFKDLAFGAGGAVILALTFALILLAISKASRKTSTARQNS